MAPYHLLLSLFLLCVRGIAAAKVNLCPDYKTDGGCSSGSCASGGMKGKFEIPSKCPLLVGYGSSAFYLSGDLPDDTTVNAYIKATKRSSAEKCCNKCKTSSKCSAWQFLNLGAYGGLCFVYKGGPGPVCTDNVLVNTRVGAKCTEISHDPHLVGAHGTHYDFGGEPDKSFCLLSDQNLHINMKMTGYLDNRTESATVLRDGKALRTWIKEVGVVWNAEGETHSLRMVARGGKENKRGDGFLARASVDGVDLPKMEVGDQISLNEGLTIKLEEVEKSGPYDVDYYSVKIEDILDMDVRIRVANPLLQRPDDAEVHFSLGINWAETTPSVHGVLGQTYREGRESRAIEFSRLLALLNHPVAADSEEGKGFLDGSPADYISSDVIKPDCAFSAFKMNTKLEMHSSDSQ